MPRKIEKSVEETKIILNASKDVKNEYLRRVKIFLDTSENEPFSLVIIEAMAYGALPIAHYSGVPRKILPREFLYYDEKNARESIDKCIMEYNEKIFNQIRERAKKFTTDKVEHQLHQAMTDTSGRRDS